LGLCKVWEESNFKSQIPRVKFQNSKNQNSKSQNLNSDSRFYIHFSKTSKSYRDNAALKVIHFLINSNIFIALAAVSLALATDAQLGIAPHFKTYLVVIFLATLSDYNLHRFIAVKNNPKARHVEKLLWAVKYLQLLKILILTSSTGLVISLFFIRIEILFVLLPLALLSFLYSIPFPGNLKKPFQLLGIPGMKTLLIALVWTAVTVFLPVIQSGTPVNQASVLLIFAERFTFIFAIAIPFDIRDIKADALAGMKTIPATFGEKQALLVCNSSMIISFMIASFHYLLQNMAFIFIAYFVSVGLTLVFINSRKIKGYPLYYHGILDGSILLHGLLISLGFFLFSCLTL